MRIPVLVLALMLVAAPRAGAPENTLHVLVGIMPDRVYEVLVDGVKVEGVEPEADDIGIVEFWLPPVSAGVHTVEIRPLTGHVLEVGDCSVSP